MLLRKLKRSFIVIFAFIMMIQLMEPSISLARRDSVKRIAGENRYETSIEISKEIYGNNKNVILASGEDFADSLSGNQLSIALDAPILLTRPDKVSNDLKNELKRLGVNQIIVLGGEKAISNTLYNELSELYSMKRLGGKNRYETSRKIYNYTSSLKNYDEVVIVSGKNYPDALSATTYLVSNNALLLLSDGSMPKTELRAVAIGGERALPLKGFRGKRIFGLDRYETAYKLAEICYSSTDNAIIASAENFPDALSASSLAKDKKAPVLLSSPNSLKNYVKNYINNCGNIYLIGGEKALSDNVFNLKSEEEVADEQKKETALSWKDDYRDLLSGKSFVEEDDHSINLKSNAKYQSSLKNNRVTQFALIKTSNFKNPLLLVKNEHGSIAAIHKVDKIYCGGSLFTGESSFEPQVYFNRLDSTVHLKDKIRDFIQYYSPKEEVYLELGQVENGLPKIVYGRKMGLQGPIIEYERFEGDHEDYESKIIDYRGANLIAYAYFNPNEKRTLSIKEYSDLEKHLSPVVFMDYNEANYRAALNNIGY